LKGGGGVKKAGTRLDGPQSRLLGEICGLYGGFLFSGRGAEDLCLAGGRAIAKRSAVRPAPGFAIGEVSQGQTYKGCTGSRRTGQKHRGAGKRERTGRTGTGKNQSSGRRPGGETDASHVRRWEPTGVGATAKAGKTRKRLRHAGKRATVANGDSVEAYRDAKRRERSGAKKGRAGLLF
jgi:hypothetical protein